MVSMIFYLYLSLLLDRGRVLLVGLCWFMDLMFRLVLLFLLSIVLMERLRFIFFFYFLLLVDKFRNFLLESFETMVDIFVLFFFFFMGEFFLLLIKGFCFVGMLLCFFIWNMYK